VFGLRIFDPLKYPVNKASRLALSGIGISNTSSQPFPPKSFNRFSIVLSINVSFVLVFYHELNRNISTATASTTHIICVNLNPSSKLDFVFLEMRKLNKNNIPPMIG
jgi:hypothetical protein